MSEANIQNLLAQVANDQALQAKISHLKESSSEEFIKGLADISAEAGQPATEDEIRAYFQHLASKEVSDEELSNSVVGGATHRKRKTVMPSPTDEKESSFYDDCVANFKNLAFRGYEAIERLF